MRICHQFKISKSQLFKNFTLDDIFDEIEYMEQQHEIEYRQSLEMQRKYNKNGG
ncbi:hypothetical protein [Silvanigrella sp.]|jgi:hypothetical protein|uniref:hypothetical protein n=1 Tax=Silvanigrella sp. TaxID=2024976 RepID=UPI0037C7B34C